MEIVMAFKLKVCLSVVNNVYSVNIGNLENTWGKRNLVSLNTRFDNL